MHNLTVQPAKHAASQGVALCVSEHISVCSGRQLLGPDISTFVQSGLLASVKSGAHDQAHTWQP